MPYILVLTYATRVCTVCTDVVWYIVDKSKMPPKPKETFQCQNLSDE